MLWTFSDKVLYWENSSIITDGPINFVYKFFSELSRGAIKLYNYSIIHRFKENLCRVKKGL